MELAGSFSRQEYEQAVRPSMIPPQVQSNNFSGLMSWEHATLMQMWKHLRPTFEHLPPTLHFQHQQFVNAYLTLVKAHRAVCEKFGGEFSSTLMTLPPKEADLVDNFLIKDCSTARRYHPKAVNSIGCRIALA